MLRPPLANKAIKKKSVGFKEANHPLQFDRNYFTMPRAWDHRNDSWYEDFHYSYFSDEWMECTENFLSRDDVTDSPLRPNGMLPTLPLSNERFIARYRLRNNWDIRGFEALDSSNITWTLFTEFCQYHLFPSRRVQYGFVQVKKHPFDEEKTWWCRAMKDESTDKHYLLPEPPYGDFEYHKSSRGWCIWYYTWDLLFYMLKPFIEEEVCNIIDAAMDDMKLLSDYPAYHIELEGKSLRKRKKTLEDYPPFVKRKNTIVKKRGLAYNGFVEYDARIDDFIDEADYLSILSEYQQIHLVVLEYAAECDIYLIERDSDNEIFHFDTEHFGVWTRRTFDEILMIIKSVKFHSILFSVDDWCHMMLSFGEGFMNVFANEKYLSHFPEHVETISHSGSIYEHEEFFSEGKYYEHDRFICNGDY
jgi:CRISPR/Cas system CMR-associated protein Cmr5 small subunit